MGTIADKLNRVLESKSQIKDALISKGVEIPDDTPFRSYPSLVDNIQTGGADLNIAFGDEAPEDTTKLWVESEEKNDIKILSETIEEYNRQKSIELPNVFGSVYFHTNKVVVGSKIYIFGGKNTRVDPAYSNSIRVFDTETEKMRNIDTTFPSGMTWERAIRVGDEIYLLRPTTPDNVIANDVIMVFNVKTETLSTLDVTIPYGASCCVETVGSNIYLIGGRYSRDTLSNTYLDHIYVLDTVTKNITLLGETIPKPAYSMSSVVIGNKIYLLGGIAFLGYDRYGRDSTESIYDVTIFDTESNSVNTLEAILPSGLTYHNYACVDSAIYLLGGYKNQTGVDTIYKLDCDTNEITLLDMRLPLARYSASVIVHDNIVYRYGGKVDPIDRTINVITAFDTENMTVDELDISYTTDLNLLSMLVVNNTVYLFSETESGETPPSENHIYVLESIKKNSISVHDVRTLDTAVLTPGQTRAIATVGKKTYLFGGDLYISPYASDNINVFDVDSNTVTTLNTTLPSKNECISAAAVGTKIYLFGGQFGMSKSFNTILIFDTLTETIVESNTVLPKKGGEYTTAVVDSKVYLFCGPSSTTEIIMFDTITEDITTLSTAIPMKTYMDASAVVVDGKIYLVGGCGTDLDGKYVYLNTIFVFDPVTEQVDVLKNILPISEYYCYNGCVSVGTNVYIWGSYDYHKARVSLCILDTCNNNVTVCPTTQRNHGSGLLSVIHDDTLYVMHTNTKQQGYIDVISLDAARDVNMIGASLRSVYGDVPLASGLLGSSVYEDKIYLFGGVNGGSVSNTINVFDSTLKNITTLKTTIPQAASAIGVAQVGSKIYLFGGHRGSLNAYQDTIHVFDIRTENIYTLDVKLPVRSAMFGIVQIDTKVYLFGGACSDEAGLADSEKTIKVFDTETETISILETTLPYKTNGIGTTQVDKKIYLFGGDCSGALNTIRVFNTEDESLLTLDAVLPYRAEGIGVARVDTKIYLFGGDNRGAVDTISVFDTVTETVTTLDITLPSALCYMAVGVIGTKIYLLGGTTDTGLSSNIYILDTEKLNNPDQLLISTSSPSHPVTLLNTGDITLQTAVNSVYKGSANGTCTKVPAHVYENGEWVEI